MERINAVTFAPFVQEVPLKRRNQTESETDERKDGSKLCDFAPNGVQKTAFPRTLITGPSGMYRMRS